MELGQDRYSNYKQQWVLRLKALMMTMAVLKDTHQESSLPLA